ncbi:MAG TPA: hypothetical protein VKS21_06530 [Spirochaetota bacterium]|nr:hypothetical protein [Spirochaetota bacterium]
MNIKRSYNCFFLTAGGRKFTDLSAAFWNSLGYNDPFLNKTVKNVLKYTDHPHRLLQSTPDTAPRRHSRFINLYKLQSFPYTYMLSPAGLTRFFDNFSAEPKGTEGFHFFPFPGQKNSAKNKLYIYDDHFLLFQKKPDPVRPSLLVAGFPPAAGTGWADCINKFDFILITPPAGILSEYLLCSRQKYDLPCAWQPGWLKLLQRISCYQNRIRFKKKQQAVAAVMKEISLSIKKYRHTAAAASQGNYYKISLAGSPSVADTGLRRVFYREITFVMKQNYLYLALPYNTPLNHIPGKIKTLLKWLQAKETQK